MDIEHVRKQIEENQSNIHMQMALTLREYNYFFSSFPNKQWINDTEFSQVVSKIEDQLMIGEAIDEDPEPLLKSES